MLAQATSNLLAGIRPTKTSANQKFHGIKQPDSNCFNSGGIQDSDLSLQTWAYDLEFSADINTVGIFFKDKPERPQKTEVRVGYSSEVSKNPLCAVSGTQPAGDPGREWQICGHKGNFVSVTFCGDDKEPEIRAYSLHRIRLRKIFSASAKPDEDRSDILWVSQSGPPSSPENAVEGSILKFNSAILISYVKMTEVSKSFAIFVTDAKKTQYPCEPVPSEGAFQEVICGLRADGIILDLAGQDLPDNIFVLTQSDPSRLKLDSNLTEQHHKNQLRQLQSCIGAGCGFCQNPTSTLNLLNTSVIAQQTSYWPADSQTAVSACDGVVFAINTITYAWDFTKITAPASTGPSQFWQATFTAQTTIKSSLIIHRDNWPGGKWRVPLYTSTFGTNSVVTQNPVFMPVGAMTDGGWYMCLDSMTGTIFGIYSITDSLDFTEILLYSQEAIQMNALSAVATNLNVPYPAANALKKFVVLLVTLTTNTCVIAGVPATGPAKVEINLKAFGQIKGVALLPGYARYSSPWPETQTSVAIQVNKVNNTKHLCGVMADYYSSQREVSCNVVGNQIIFEQQTSGREISFCGVGVFSDCNCALSQFDPTSFTTAPTATLVSANSMTKYVGDSITLTVIISSTVPDTVSSLCGNGDGTSKCGLRTIKFYDSSNQEIDVWPYLGLIWDSIASKISLPGTYQTPGTFTADVEISLTLNPLVKMRQTITVAVLPEILIPTTPSAPTTAISGTDVIITWVAPVDGGSAITGYNVQIQKSDGVTYLAYAGCTGTAVSCTVPISVLQAEPFNLAAGSGVFAQVKATNAIGSSPFSTASNKTFMSIPSQKLNAVIGKELTLLLPPFTGVFYTVLSNPQYQVSVDGNLLKVKSDSVQNIGSHTLQMNARTSSASSNFTVNVIFSKGTHSDFAVTAKVTKKKESIVFCLLASKSDSLLERTISCTLNEAGTLFCITSDITYCLNPNGSANFVNVEERPTLSASKVSSRGEFTLKFSQAMKIEAFQNTTNYRQVQEVNKTTQNVTQVKYKYLLSSNHLRIDLRSVDTTYHKFTWYAKNITNTTIDIQLFFDDPLSISNDRNSLDSLSVTILPPALNFFQTIDYGALTQNPLENFTLTLPPQVILGPAIDYVSQAAKFLELAGQYEALANLAVQLAISGSMSQMWSIVNSFQIVSTFYYFTIDPPGNVQIVMVNLSDMLALSALPTERITSELFNFTKTQSAGANFAQMGNDSKLFTLYIGNLFYVGVFLFSVYILYGLVHCCGKFNKTSKKIDFWLFPKLICSAAIRYQLETTLDFGIGTLLKFEEPNFYTGSDIFDFVLSIIAVIFLLALPFTQIICLCKNKNRMDDRKFKLKWGSLYSQLKTYTPEQRERAIIMLSWFLFRRLITALNLVELRNQTVWLQLTFNMYLCLADACLNFHWSPNEKNLRNIMEKLNGVFVLLLSYLLWMQTDLISSAADRYYIGYYYLGVLGFMVVVNFSVVIIAAVIGLSEKFKQRFVQRKLIKSRALQRNNFRLAQKGVLPAQSVVDSQLLSSRSKLVLEILKQQQKPQVDYLKVIFLQDRLEALDAKKRERNHNIPQEVQIESDIEMGSQQQAEFLVDQVQEFAFYEKQKDEGQQDSSNLSVIESEESSQYYEQSSQWDQSKQMVSEVASSARNKAEHRRQPNEGKITQTQMDNDWETELWQENHKKVVPADEDAQEQVQLKLRNRQQIVEEKKWDQTVLKEEIFDKVIKTLKVAKDPMVASKFVEIQAMDNAFLLSNDISRKSVKDQETEVKAIIQICPEYIKNQNLFESYTKQAADFTAKIELLEVKIEEKEAEVAYYQDLVKFYENEADQVRRNLGYASLESVWETRKLLNEKEIEIRKDCEEVRQLAKDIADLKKKAAIRRRYFI